MLLGKTNLCGLIPSQGFTLQTPHTQCAGTAALCAQGAQGHFSYVFYHINNPILSHKWQRLKLLDCY